MRRVAGDGGAAAGGARAAVACHTAHSEDEWRRSDKRTLSSSARPLRSEARSAPLPKTARAPP
eukprot:4487042-Prymnesium_polylepis.1